MVQDCKPGGTFLINCGYTVEELGNILPVEAKQYIAQNHVNVYTIDAVKIGKELGLGTKYNMVLMSAFFKLANIIPIDDAVQYMKEACESSYGKFGEETVQKNKNAVDAGLTGLVKLEIPADWATTTVGGSEPSAAESPRPELNTFIQDVMVPANAMRGDEIPVSKLMSMADGTLPSGSAAYEKRGIAVDVPVWIPENCIQCNRCAYVCPHAVIRPAVLNDEELANAPQGTKTVKMLGKGTDGLHFAITVSPMDCTGCGSCVNVCPAKNKALVMKPLAESMDQETVFSYAGRGRHRKAPALQVQHRQGFSVQDSAVRVLRSLCRLRRDALRKAYHAALWRPYAHRQRHWLLLHLGCQRSLHPLYGQQEGTGSRLGQLSV